MDYTKSASQLADMLERTPSGVFNRRHTIKTRRNKQEARERLQGVDTE